MKKTTDYAIHLNIRKESFAAASRGGTFAESRSLTARNVAQLFAARPAGGPGSTVRPLSNAKVAEYENPRKLQADLAAGALVPRSAQAVLHRGYSTVTLNADVEAVELNLEDPTRKPFLDVIYTTNAQ